MFRIAKEFPWHPRNSAAFCNVIMCATAKKFLVVSFRDANAGRNQADIGSSYQALN